MKKKSAPNELLADKKRLDWMEDNDIQVWLLWDGTGVKRWKAYSPDVDGKGATIRQAIDNAMKREKA